MSEIKDTAPFITYLTVKRLTEDLAEFDPETEVAVVMHGGGLTVPINSLMRLEASERVLALLIVNEESVRHALDLNNKAREAAN